jgi:hypothetical protein
MCQRQQAAQPQKRPQERSWPQRQPQLKQQRQLEKEEQHQCSTEKRGWVALVEFRWVGTEAVQLQRQKRQARSRKERM